jgi:hypothetical protein
MLDEPIVWKSWGYHVFVILFFRNLYVHIGFSCFLKTNRVYAVIFRWREIPIYGLLLIRNRLSFQTV